jgi:hypothetical protein
LVDAQNDEGAHHGQGVVSHDAGVKVQEFWKYCVHNYCDEQAGAGSQQDEWVKPVKK